MVILPINGIFVHSIHLVKYEHSTQYIREQKASIKMMLKATNRQNILLIVNFMKSNNDTRALLSVALL